MKARILTLVSILATCLPFTAQAADEGDWRVGALAGQVSLLGDVGDDDPNGVGFGATAGYYVQDNIALEASFLNSSHTSVNHNALSFGVNYYLGDYLTAYPHLDGGVSFISNKIKTVDTTGDAFAFFAGGGFDFEVSEFFNIGLQARYNLAFEGKARVNGQNITTVDDDLTVLLRFLYRFNPE